MFSVSWNETVVEILSTVAESLAFAEILRQLQLLTIAEILQTEKPKWQTEINKQVFKKGRKCAPILHRLEDGIRLDKDETTQYFTKTKSFLTRADNVSFGQRNKQS